MISNDNLELVNVSKIYNVGLIGEYHALENINLKFDNSGLTLIIGESGSGKTTLLNVIAGFDSISSGEIVKNYDDFYASFVFQDSQLLNDFTVLDNLKYIEKIIEVEDKSEYYLKKFNLFKYKDHKANELSGGQKQKLSIIRALILNKPILLCDEPTGNLDSKNSIEIANILKEEAKNRLIIVVSHDYELFSKVADRIIEISDGKIISDKTINKINSNVCFENKKTNLKLSTASHFSIKNIKKSPIRFVLTTISLTISLLIIIIGLNVFMTDEAASRDKIYSKECLTYINALDNSSQYSDSSKGVSYEEYNNINKKYNDIILCTDKSFLQVVNTNNLKTMIVDEVNYPIKYGTKFLDYKEIIISDVMAYDIIKKENIDVNNILGYIPNEYFGYKIVGVYDSGFDILNPPKNYIIGSKSTIYNRTLFINYKTYKNYLSQEGLSIRLNNSSYDINIEIDSTLNGNEISASKNLNLNIGINNLSYLNSYYYQKDIYEKEDYSDEDYSTIEVNIISIVDGNTLYVSSDLYNKLLEEVGIYKDDLVGVAYSNYNKEKIEHLLELGFEFDTDIDVYISKTLDFEMKAGIIELVIGCLLLFVTMVLIVNYVFNNFMKNRREIGILASVWVRKEQMWKLFFIDLMILIIISNVLAALISPLIINLQNQIAINSDGVKIDYLYYMWSPSLIVFLIVFMFGSVSMFIANKKILKKNIVDLIYER